jgi:pimeloyl-ACP methyl ester carboxylesterase
VKRVIIMLMLFLGACAPRLQAPGTESVDPAITADHLVMADGTRLPLRVWLPAGQPKAVILALHGINDYSNAFEAPGEHWAAAGIATYAYDQRGFGETAQRGLWPGETQMMDDLRTAAALVGKAHPGVPLYLLGESMGGRRRGDGGDGLAAAAGGGRCDPGGARRVGPGDAGAGADERAVDGGPYGAVDGADRPRHTRPAERQYRDAAQALGRPEGDQGDARRHDLWPGQPDGPRL